MNLGMDGVVISRIQYRQVESSQSLLLISHVSPAEFGDGMSDRETYLCQTVGDAGKRGVWYIGIRHAWTKNAISI